MVSIVENLLIVRQKIQAAEQNEPVTLIAVSKFQPEEAVRQALEAGCTELGENYPQHLAQRVEIFPHAHWHMIGQMQTNKVKYCIGHMRLLQSLDREALAQTVNRLASAREMIQDALVQVNIGLEPQKGGVNPEELDAFLETMQAYTHIHVRGLMAIPPADQPPEPYFARMRQLYDRVRVQFPMDILSMGMSHDYETAIRMGANMVRVGTAIFGPRAITH